MAQSKLEQSAIDERKKEVVKNSYNDSDQANNYSPTHTKALSDQETPIKGKGTGTYLDTQNGGGQYDINGNPLHPGSGRVKNVAVNKYDSQNGYKAPDTSLNEGQVRF